MTYKKIKDENDNDVIQLSETKESVTESFTLRQILIKKIKYEKKIESLNNKISKIISDTDLKQKDFDDEYQNIINNNLWV